MLSTRFSAPRRALLTLTLAFLLAALGAATASAAVDAKINFQPDSALVPAGYTKDTGSPYSATAGMGWVREDSLGLATHTPVDLTLNTRQRNAVTDLRQDTFMSMQLKAGSAGVTTPGAWELAVPNGSYAVTVGVGDASYTDSVHHINAEGQTLLPNFSPTTSLLFQTASGIVTVADGRLTIDGIGGTNTKLDYITVKDVDTTPPAQVTGVQAAAGDGQVALTWSPSTATDFASYRVFRGTSTPVSTSGTPLKSGLTTASYTDTTAVNGTTYSYVVQAVDSSGNAGTASTAVSATPVAATTATDLAINFQTQTSTTPAGYQGDYGLPYDATRGYGWVDASGAPLSLVGNGRQRDANPDPLLDTFMSMQLKAGSDGVSTAGSWKAKIANGTYQVTLAAGDASYADSHHVLNVEGTPALDFTPAGTTLFQTNTVTVTVTDGVLNVDATGGTNTKIDFLRAQKVSATAPKVTAVTPANGSTNVCRDQAVTVQLSDGVDPTTATSAGLQILTAGGTQVTGFYNTDGAYSNATFVPSATLSPNATYTVKTTAALKSPAGTSYTPFTSTFTTADSTCAAVANVNFNQSTFDFSDGTAATTTAYKTEGPSAMALGPNPSSPTQLWVAFGTGNILVYNLNPSTGAATGAPTQVSTFKFNRLVTGLRFDPSSTASNVKLWVSNGQFGCDLAALGIACDNYTGAISTLTGTGTTALTKTDIVTGLPRSVGNHMNNGIDFGPDGALYLAQGAQNGYGAPDPIWGNRSEDVLSAAILRVDVAGITSPPYNVNTSTGYNPNAAGAKVTLYATGTRNPFSVLWHSNGKLYAPVNESASGNTPADPAGGAPAMNDLPSYDDYFTQIVPGKYYGHPNPARGEYRLNGGNPTSGVDPFEVPEYPVGTQPNANWRQPDMDLGIHRSADGSVEYKSSVFGSELQNKILVTEYSQGKDIIAVKLDSSGKAVSKSVVASGFYNPLPITVDQATGRIYVGEYGRDPDGVGGKITLLTPNPTTTTTGYHVNFQTDTSTTPTGYTADYGQAFDTVRGYGWEALSDGSPVSLVGNGRERGVVADKRLDTFMSMQLKAGSAGVATPGRWEMVVPNGTYTLTVGAGDPSYTDSHHVINAEGQKILDFTPTASTTTTTVTTTVTITDGRLTLTPTNGDNTKIAFVDLVPTTTTPPTTGALTVSSPEDNLGLGSRMVFSTVKNQARTGHSLTLKNTGTAAINVTGLTLGGTNGADFQLCTGQGQTFTIAVGGTATVCVQFRPATAAATRQISNGTLTIASNATNSPSVVTLGGLNTKDYEGVNEPNVQQVLDALGYKNTAPVIDKPTVLSTGPASTPIGDEVLAPYFKAADTTKSVSLIPLARYAGQPGNDSQQFGWFSKGSTTTSYLYAFPGGTTTGGTNDGYGQNQLLLPTPTTGTLTFSPSGVFGIRDSTGLGTDDALNSLGKWHDFRVWPAKNGAGSVIPNTYILGEDQYDVLNQPFKNWDYQDHMFLLTNATPDTTAAQPTAGEVAKALASFPGTAGGIANTGFTSTQGTLTTSNIAFSGGNLGITTSADSATSHTNALQLGVNGGTGARIQSRLVGPFTSIDAGSEQQGIYYGPSGTNHIKADIEWSASTASRRLVITKVVSGTATTVTSAALPAGTISTLDLRIDVAPTDANGADPAVTVSYAVNGSSTFTALSTAAITLPTSWLTANTPAGIVTSSLGGAPFTASYASFSIARSY